MCFCSAGGDNTGDANEDGTGPCHGVEGFPPEYPTEEGGKYHVSVCEWTHLRRGCEAVSFGEQDLSDCGQKADKDKYPPYLRLG